MSTAIVVLLLLLALQLDAQLTVDDNGGSCESSTSDEIVNLIKDSWRDLKSTYAQYAPNQQPPVAVDTSGLCESLVV